MYMDIVTTQKAVVICRPAQRERHITTAFWVVTEQRPANWIFIWKYLINNITLFKLIW